MLHSKWQKKEIRNIIWGGFISLLFLIQPLLASPLKIAILDTGFCLEKLTPSKNITLRESIDLTKSNNFDCNNLSKENRRLHGNWVLNQFLKEIKTTEPIEISPFIVFNKNAKQESTSWLEAFKKQEDFHLFIIAAGIRDVERLNPIEIKTPLFVAGATIGRGIGYKTVLWPQNQFKNPLVFTIGSYSMANEDLPARPDYTLINPSQMKFFLSAGDMKSSFNGSSMATATAAARSVNYCYKSFLTKKGVESCLKKSSKSIDIFNDTEKLKIPTL